MKKFRSVIDGAGAIARDHARVLGQDPREGDGPTDNSGEYGQSVCAVIDAIYRSDATGTEQDVIVVPSPGALV